MSQPPFALNVGGRSYSIFSDAGPEALCRLAELLDIRVRACDPSGRMTPVQALLYAALTLVDDLEREKTAHRNLQIQAQSVLRDALTCIDQALTPPDHQCGNRDNPSPHP